MQYAAIVSVIEKHVKTGGKNKEMDYESGKPMDAPDSLSWSFCDFDLRGACFSVPFELEGGIINGRLDLSDADFKSGLCFRKMWFWGPLVFDGSRFRAAAVFSGPRKGEPEPEIYSRLSFDRYGFDTSFRGADFERGLSMRRLSFRGPVSFEGCRVRGNLDLSGLTFRDSVEPCLCRRRAAATDLR